MPLTEVETAGPAPAPQASSWQCEGADWDLARRPRARAMNGTMPVMQAAHALRWQLEVEGQNGKIARSRPCEAPQPRGGAEAPWRRVVSGPGPAGPSRLRSESRRLELRCGDWHRPDSGGARMVGPSNTTRNQGSHVQPPQPTPQFLVLSGGMNPPSKRVQALRFRM